MINIRPAILPDCQQLFDWRNMPFIYEKGYSGKPVRRHQHDEWFQRILISENIKIFIIQYQHYPIGMIRFDRFEMQDNFIVSIYIEEDHTKRGFGPIAIKRGIDRIRERVPQAEFHAGFLADNIASKKAFAKAGFIQVTENTMRYR